MKTGAKAHQQPASERRERVRHELDSAKEDNWLLVSFECGGNALDISGVLKQISIYFAITYK